jgi:hypothetical protein
MRKNQQTLWDFAEQRAAQFFNGERVRASGMGFYKSDVHQTVTTETGQSVNDPEGYRVEVKSTVKDKMSFKSSWLGKIAREAKDAGQKPGFYLMFGDQSAFALVPYEDELHGGPPPREEEVPGLGLEKHRMITPIALRWTITETFGGGLLRVSPEVFIAAGCGKGFVFPVWRVMEDE